MARPVWSGTISFGLVAIPVKLFHAVRRQSVSFNQLDDRNMARIRYRKVNAETGDEVGDDHIVKGYEISKGRYVVVDPDELEPFMPVATKSVDLEEFVDLADIDPVYFDTAYHLAPDGPPKPYVLLARAMEASGKVAIGRFVMRNKQFTAAIRAQDGRLVMSTLAYADEVLDPSEIDELQGLDAVDVNDKEVAMAESLVDSLAADFEPEKYHDEYREQVMALIQMKADGEEFEVPEVATEKPKVVDIMAALEASVAAAKEARARHPSEKAPKKAAKKSA
jgi:DNA end-binding protein Ku